MSLPFPQIINQILEAWSVKTLREHLPAKVKLEKIRKIEEIVRELKPLLSIEEDLGFTLVKEELSKFDSTLAKQLAQIEVLWKVGVSIVEDPWGILSNSIFVSNSQH